MTYHIEQKETDAGTARFVVGHADDFGSNQRVVWEFKDRSTAEAVVCILTEVRSILYDSQKALTKVIRDRS